MSSGLAKWDRHGDGVRRPARLSRVEERHHERAMARLERTADRRSRAIELEAEVGLSKVYAVGTVGSGAMTGQAIVSGKERLLVESEPGAVHGISHISQRVTLALAEVVERTLRGVTR